MTDLHWSSQNQPELLLEHVHELSLHADLLGEYKVLFIYFSVVRGYRSQDRDQQSQYTVWLG